MFVQLLFRSAGSETAGQGESLLETGIWGPLLQALTLPGSPTDSALMSSKVVLWRPAWAAWALGGLRLRTCIFPRSGSQVGQCWTVLSQVLHPWCSRGPSGHLVHRGVWLLLLVLLSLSVLPNCGGCESRGLSVSCTGCPGPR